MNSKNLRTRVDERRKHVIDKINVDSARREALRREIKKLSAEIKSLKDSIRVARCGGRRASDNALAASKWREKQKETLGSARKKRARWTEAEKKIIMESTANDKEIAIELGRTFSAVPAMRRLIKLRYR